MKEPYEFLQPLSRLKDAHKRFIRTVWALNAAIISAAIYTLAEITGIPAFMDFYYQDYVLLKALPAIICVILGFAGAMFIKKRRDADIFPLLGAELSEKAKAGYDNRDVDSFPMQSLADELRTSLAKIKPSEILNSRQISSRMTLVAFLLAAAFILAKSEIAPPSDFPPLNDLIDKVSSVFQEEKPENVSSTQLNLTGNIFGNPSLAVLNENRMEIQLHPGLGIGSMARNIQPVERAFQQSLAGEASAVSSELYIESLPPENREIIKKYFTILSESGG